MLSDRARWWARLAAVFSVQYLGAIAGSVLHLPGTNVGLVWPPAGLTLGLLMLWGPELWPAIFAAQMLKSFPDLGPTRSVAAALLVAAVQSGANAVSTVLGARWVLRATSGDASISRLRDVASLALWGGGLAQGLSAAIGVASIWLAGVRDPAALLDVGIDWWLSNVVSVLVLAPLVLAWRPPLVPSRPLVQQAGFYALTVLVAALVFGWVDPSSYGYFSHLTVLLVLAGAFLMGRQGATATALILTGAAILAIVAGRGIFPPGDLGRELLLLNFYVATLSITGLVVAAILEERGRAERQREQLREQLLHTQKMESIGLLAGGVAHDLNNLLSPILGYTELLLADLPGGPVADDLREIKRAGERARDITQRLLAFSRKQVLDLRTVDLGATMQAMEKLLRRTLPEDVRVVLEIPSPPGPVRADPAQIEQVVMNLAINAQHAMPRGGELRIRLRELEVGERPPPDTGLPAGAWVLLTVQDTGCGMEKAVLERAFEPFFTTKPAGQGSGLGLSIVHGIVSQHGGRVFVESAPGRGTTFRIYLPRSAGKPRPARVPSAAAARGDETILLAEDDSGTRGIAVRMLRGLGYRVLEAADAASCLRHAADEQGGIDLLLSDVVMPDTDGRQLYERVARLRPSIKVLFVSGYAGEVLTERGVLLPGTRLLAKPFTLERLAAAVRAALDDEPISGSFPKAPPPDPAKQAP